MKTVLLTTLVFLISLFITPVLHGVTIHVPTDSVTIQAGINGAADGDTVLVADGTYTGEGNRDIDFYGKRIVLTSENGPEHTIIDCGADSLNHHRGFYFHHTAADSNSIVEGFTITNGWTPQGGGAIRCIHSSPKIVGNIISGNTAGDYSSGGGIHCDFSSAIIEGNVITGNIASGNAGGGIRSWNSELQIRRNIVSDNTTGWIGNGGGIYCDDFDNSTVVITDNIIIGNVTAETGGGIYCGRVSGFIVGNTIAWNSAEYGGGMSFWQCPGDIFLESNTFYGNIATERGGGISCTEYSFPTILNTIMWGDSSGFGGEIHQESGSFPIVTYSNISSYWPGEGNIHDDPLFVDPASGDFNLLPDSPCIDTGDPESPNIPWGGFRRDMGAFEYDLGFYYDGQNTILKPFPIELPVRMTQ